MNMGTTNLIQAHELVEDIDYSAQGEIWMGR